MEYLPILEERERIAEDVLTNQQLIVDYDRKRNTNREALTKLRRQPAHERKLWVNFGDMFIKMENEKVKTLIEKDQKNIDKEIDAVRETVKEKMLQLEKLETGENEKMKGFNLRGMTAKELYNITGYQKVDS
ncbi:hypothetical protein G9A89_008807 [Geosiphon pyriformis]|nr:hypothetical protein G9A89_008807 [Geosiphon pyriformis]